jgi:hypothetical protein
VCIGLRTEYRTLRENLSPNNVQVFLCLLIVLIEEYRTLRENLDYILVVL